MKKQEKVDEKAVPNPETSSSKGRGKRVVSEVILNLNSLKKATSYKPLWELNIEELSGHNIEAKGREEVNMLLKKGWILLHIYTLKYQEDGIWRERPMAILGRPKTV
jgi:hypothetical protein